MRHVQRWPRLSGAAAPEDGAKRIHGDERRLRGGDFGDDPLQYGLEIAARGLRGEVDESHRRRYARGIKELELPLVAGRRGIHVYAFPPSWPRPASRAE